MAAADYLSRPEAEVRTDLEGLGLTVAVDLVGAAAGEVGTVKDVTPDGRRSTPGSRVTLEVVAERRHPEPDKPSKDKKPGRGREAQKKKGH